jgi:restriction endonuclease Mrr
MRNDMPSAIEIESAMLRVLSANNNGLHTREMRNAVAGFLELSEEVLRVQRVGSRQEFGYRLAWARTKAQQKGLVERIDVATWKITDLGETSILK